MIKWFKKLRDRYRERRIERSISPIRICSFYTIWGYLGYPKEVGTLIQATMQSGKIAVYKLDHIDYELDPKDMFWVVFNFDHYKREDEPEYPDYTGDYS